jgi:hypothetical protein
MAFAGKVLEDAGMKLTTVVTEVGDLLTPIADLLYPISSQVTELAHGRRWHNAPEQQPTLEQLCQPLAILRICLAPRHTLDAM